MTRTVLAPIVVLSGIIGFAVLAAAGVFDPLIRFIHADNITPLQAGACLVFTVAFFAGYLALLNLICSYFVPRIEANQEENVPVSATRLNEEIQLNH